MISQFIELKTRLTEIADLNKIGWVLNWDQQTMMAPKGAAVRAEQMRRWAKSRTTNSPPPK